MKEQTKCILCNSFLREKTRKNNDFKTRMLCVKCFKETGYDYYALKKNYPQKVIEFFEKIKSNDNKKDEKDNILTFGKYKGKKYDLVINDKEYCKWCLSISNLANNPFIKYLNTIYNNGAK